MTRRWTVRLAACLVSGTALLTGCAEKQGASSSLPSASSAEATQEELPPLGPEDFPVPDEAREKTPEGAEAFVRYYLDLAEAVAETPFAPQPLLTLSIDCSTCQRIADAYSADQSSAYLYEDYSHTFAPHYPIFVNGNTAEVGFTYQQSEVRVTDSAGSPVPDRSAPSSEPLASGARLTWDATAKTWLMSNLAIG